MNGSDIEPVDPRETAVQMRDATERLREQGWMVAPVTSAAVIPAEALSDETPLEQTG